MKSKKIIVYCSECDTYGIFEKKENNYCECSCGEHMPELDITKVLVILTSQQLKIGELVERVDDTENALTGAIDCINKMKCCGNCDNEELYYRDNECKFYGSCREVMKTPTPEDVSHWTKRID